jgi:hypothetical protein
MKRLFTTVLPGLLLAGALGACTVHGTARGGFYAPAGGVVVVEQEPPPPPPRRVVVYRPGYVYIEGRYAWNGNRYLWRDGYYERERSGHVYRPGRWQRQGRGHVWVEGRWEAGGSTRDRRHDDRSRVRDHRR